MLHIIWSMDFLHFSFLFLTFEKNKIMSNSQCPLCGASNFSTNIAFNVNGEDYVGLKCNNCNNLIFSCPKAWMDDYSHRKERNADTIKRQRQLGGYNPDKDSSH